MPASSPPTTSGAAHPVGFDPELTNENSESGILHRQVAKLNEVSILRRGLPAHRGAQVTHLLELPQRAKPAGTEAGEVFWGGQTLRRPSGQVIGVR